MTIGQIPVSVSRPQVSASQARTPATETAAPSQKLAGEAAKAQGRGGILAEHTIGMQKLATAKQVCVFIRAVNPESITLIREGFGTKDMAIKGKSSNIPPLSALIPRDQTLGKKPAEAGKFSAYNEASLEKGTATAIKLELSPSRIKELLSSPKADAANTPMEVRGNFLDVDPSADLAARSGTMTSTVNGKEHTFWGEKQANGQIAIFRADKGPDGALVKGEAIEVMGNRQGKAVTADYDLALVAPRMQDYGSEHTRPLKMTSFEEVAVRTGRSADTMARPTPELDKHRKVPVDAAPIKASDLFKREVEIAENTTRVTYDRVDGLDKEGAETPKRDMGNISNFTRDLIPQLNKACGAKEGGELFHHSDDAGNPFSVEADNYPMTVILPDSSSLPEGGEKIQIIENREELVSLFKDLKNSGFAPTGTYKWGEEVMNVRSDAFVEARRNLGRIMADQAIESAGPRLEAATKQGFAAKREFFGASDDATRQAASQKIHAAEEMRTSALEALRLAQMDKSI